MRAFKKLVAGAIATAIAATMATSAFAASFADGKVSFATATEGVYDYNAVGQTTVLVVPAVEWESETPLADLADTDILYINQYEDAGEANAAIIAGFGVKLNAEGTLTDGDYYALFGGKTGEAGAFAITAVKFNVSSTPAGPTIAWCDVNRDGSVDTADATKLLRFLSTADAWISEYAENEAEKVRVCDVNKDSAVDTADATKLLRYLSTAEAWPVN